ncbi:MAG: FRG domain-containing protein [Phycisphaerales bacterium]|nr:FRG domain-containing protein [Phycisphaerales bacterium]
MPAVQIHTVESLNEYIEKLAELQEGSSSSLWYRGCKDATWELLPSLYRHKEIDSVAKAKDFEDRIRIHFNNRSLPFLADRPRTEWDTLFLMQHYGVPTRLLDWTENSLVSLFFSVMDCVKTESGRSFETDAAVWVLDPMLWNQAVLASQSYEGGVLSTEDDAVRTYSQLDDIPNMQTLPVCIFASHNSARIVAQRGTFTVFGKGLEPMEKSFVSEKLPAAALCKIKVRKSKIATLQRQLVNAGYTDSMLYPDLDGLAREIKRELGYS